MRRPRLKRTLLVLSPFILVALFCTEENLRGYFQLARSKQRLIAQGEKLEVRELLPTVPADSRSNALELLKFADGPSNNPSFPGLMQFVAPGKARVLWKQTDLRDFDATNSWDALDAHISALGGSLSNIDDLLEARSFDFGFIYGPTHFWESDEYLYKVKKISLWSQEAILHDLHQNDHLSAIRRIEQILNQADALKAERHLIGQSVRISMARMAWQASWEALQAPGWSDAQLAQLAAVWSSRHFVGDMALTVDMERAMSLALMDKLRTRDPEIMKIYFAPAITGVGVGDGTPDKSRELESFLLAHVVGATCCFTWAAQVENRFLNCSQKYVEAARFAADKKSATEIISTARNVEQDLKSEGSYARFKYYLAWALLPSPEATQKAWFIESEKSLLLTAIALKRHEIRYEKPTSELGTLVPEFLAEIPIDYMNGKALNYRLNPDGTWLLYSVGKNGKNDGGDPSSIDSKQEYRWIWSGKDAIWPAPASLEEINSWWEKSNPTVRQPGKRFSGSE